MRGWLLTPLIFCLPTAGARANPAAAPGPAPWISAPSPAMAPPWPGEECRGAIAAAERGHGIPPQLLAAIGRVESGRRDPSTGSMGAWPWTINAEGEGAYFESKAEAIAAVTALRARGVRSIDVGCMQVNLMHHPTAFTTLEMAFDPAANADYAARFLGPAFPGQSGDWNKATADYHSAYPPEGEPYAAKVLSVWPEEQRKAGLARRRPWRPPAARRWPARSRRYRVHQPPECRLSRGCRPCCRHGCIRRRWRPRTRRRRSCGPPACRVPRSASGDAVPARRAGHSAHEPDGRARKPLRNAFPARRPRDARIAIAAPDANAARHADHGGRTLDNAGQ